MCLLHYELNLYKMTSFESIIFTAKFVIFYVMRVVDVITPVLTLSDGPSPQT